MTPREKELAQRYAAIIQDHERRGDYGGTHNQAARDFRDCVFAWSQAPDGTPQRRYRMPSGRLTADVTKAITAWADQ